MNQFFLQTLRTIVGTTNVLLGDDKAGYEIEWRGRQRGDALAIVRPGSTQEVQEVIRACADAKVAVVPQGGNTGLAAGAIPDSSGTQIVLSMKRLQAVRKVDLPNTSVTVEAGCTLYELKERMSDIDMLFPLSMGSEGSCTIGGMLATNAGGAQAVRYGNARNLCLGLEYVTASGELVSELGGLRKDNTGFDLRDLIIGSEGCLGVITAATLQIFDAPTATATAWVGVSRIDAAVELLRECQRSYGRTLTSFEVMNRLSLELVEEHFPQSNVPFLANSVVSYFVLLQADDTGTQDSLQSRLEGVLQLALEREIAVDAAIAESQQRAKQFWSHRENVVLAQAKVPGVVNFDISLPVSSIPKYLREIEAALARTYEPLPIVNFGHLGDGNLHFSLHTSEATTLGSHMVDAELMLRDLVYETVLRMGGSFSAEHGIGSTKAMTLRKYKGGPRLEMMHCIKSALDPHGVLNPGKVLLA